MQIFDKDQSEDILLQLDSNNYIFPEFGFVKDNNKLCVLGKGGFSSVYEVYYKERPEYKYAIKVIGFERHVVTSEQFWNTSRLQSMLADECPYVCRILDAKELNLLFDDDGGIASVRDTFDERWNEDGLHLQFILMEKLCDVIARDRFKKTYIKLEQLSSEDEVLEFAIQIGKALHTAHSHSILHRDVKLENIFFDDNDRVYKLGDFGIAKFVEGGNAETVVYTDGYGAPEIERRLNDYYDATADIYSFGITLYLLLNDMKFPGSNGYFANPIQYDPQFTFPAPRNASEHMSSIIRHMCAYDVENRYQSLSEVLIDLIKLNEANGNKKEDESIDVFLTDIETETFKENPKVKNKKSNKTTEASRSQRKLMQQEENESYKGWCVWYLISGTILLSIMIGSTQLNAAYYTNWKLIIFALAVLTEAILIKINEFHLFGGLIAVGVGVFSAYSIGITPVHILLFLALIIGISTLDATSSIATLVWIVLMISQKKAVFEFIHEHDLVWLIFIMTIFNIHRLFRMNVIFGKLAYFHALSGIFILDKLYLLMTFVGIALVSLQYFNVLIIPEIINEFHIIRSGIILFIIYVVMTIFEEDDEIAQEDIEEAEMND